MSTTTPTTAGTPASGTTGVAGKNTIAEGVVAKVAGIAAREVHGVHDLGTAAARAVGAIRTAINAQDRSQGVSAEPGIVSTDVSAFRVRRQTVLRITANARRGASPVELRRTIDRVVEQWDALLGEPVPVVIQIVGGVRSRLSAETRLD